MSEVQSPFDKEFQIGFIQALIQHKDQARELTLVVDDLEGAFDNDLFKSIVRIISHFYQHPDFGEAPTLAQMQHELQLQGYNVRDSLTQLYQPVSNGSYFIEQGRQFVRHMQIRKTTLQLSEALDTGSTSEAEEILEKATAQSVRTDFDIGIDYVRHERNYSDDEVRVPTLIGPLDEVLRGGLAIGELGVAIAPPGRGKSQFLVWMGQAAYQSELTVVHYTLELSANNTCRRYDACLTNIPYYDLEPRQHEALTKLNEIHQKTGEEIIIREYPMRQVGVKEIKGHLQGLKRRDIIPDLVIIDYADLLRGPRSGEERRIEQESIYAELKALCQTEEVPIWTASQTNRGAVGMELFGMDNIAESFGKAMIADVMMTICQNESQYEEGELLLYIVKNRNNKTGDKIPLFCDFSKSRFYTGHPKPPPHLAPTEGVPNAVPRGLPAQPESTKRTVGDN